MLDDDGVMILLPVAGRMQDGVYYDGAVELRPGDDRYDELLPQARRNPRPTPQEPTRPVDPETRALLRQAMGLGADGAQDDTSV
jgi:hypothetical protein